ncbi:golgin subfamily B member 1-like isoform X1 [Rhopilema esculentum]|uniref:golgin subfamily B member 1-like isoform X1 n=1 Tax=Rhopilema esculentum TaxID=499914 RepID=UPI0031CDCF32
MESRENFVKPQHPLPKEIQSMKPDETVCQFCGVSYLIHNEIKKLEEEILFLQKKLKQYEGFDEREENLLQQLTHERSRSKELGDKLLLKEEGFKDLADKLKETDVIKKEFEVKYELCDAKLQEREKIVSNLIIKGKGIKKLLKGVQEVIFNLKTEKDALIKDFTEVKNQKDEELLRALITLKEIACQNEKEKNQKITECNELRRELDACRGNCTKLKGDLGRFEEFVQAKNDLERSLLSRTKELEEKAVENSKLAGEKESVSDALNKIKSLLSERNHKLMEMESSLKASESTCNKAIEEKTKLEREFNQEKGIIYEQLKDREDQIEWLKKSSDKEKEEMSTASVQLKVLKECLDKAKMEVAMLKKEREDMIAAHQNRIAQLRDSFKQKMLEADSWPKKLEEELTKQRLQLNEEKNQLWEELTNSFQKEIQDLRNAQEKEKEEYMKNERQKTGKIQKQYETLQRRSREEIINLETMLSKNKEKQDSINRSQEALIQNLEMKITDLESRLLNMQTQTLGEDGSYKQKYLDTKRALDYITVDFEKLETDLATKKEEVNLLQETVRRECEERFELTDALSEARLKLLSIEKRTTTSKHLQNRMLPSPPASGTGRSKIDKANSIESMDGRIKSTQCSASQETGVTFVAARSISEEESSRRRIADALAKNRASSRASFDKFR